MNARELTRAIKLAVYQTAVKGTVATLVRPPGRCPDLDLVTCSEWFNKLKPEDRDIVVRIVDMSAAQATYNFLLALDGLIALEPAGPKGKLELFYNNGKSRVRLNDEGEEQLCVLFKERE